jgi:hypothetical protein
MERRYLVATLAIIATFAVFSRGLRTLEHVSLVYGQRAGADLKAKCNADSSAASRFMGRVRTHLRPGYPEEAQLLAEMNLPIAMVQTKVAEQIARQNMDAAQCARATAMREAERAQREATRMREKMARSTANVSAMPIAWETNVEAEVDRRVQAQTAALAERMVAQSVRLQMAADRVREVSLRVSDSDAADADSAYAQQDPDSNSESSREHCNAVHAQQQAAQTARARTRAIVHEVQHSFGYR